MKTLNIQKIISDIKQYRTDVEITGFERRDMFLIKAKFTIGTGYLINLCNLEFEMPKDEIAEEDIELIINHIIKHDAINSGNIQMNMKYLKNLYSNPLSNNLKEDINSFVKNSIRLKDIPNTHFKASAGEVHSWVN